VSINCPEQLSRISRFMHIIATIEKWDKHVFRKWNYVPIWFPLLLVFWVVVSGWEWHTVNSAGLHSSFISLTCYRGCNVRTVCVIKHTHTCRRMYIVRELCMSMHAYLPVHIVWTPYPRKRCSSYPVIGCHREIRRTQSKTEFGGSIITRINY